MDLPEVVREALNDEPVAARVGLGGKDLLLVTPSRTVVYRGDGLLSDEAVSEYPHGAERIEIERGRRTSTVVLDYGLDGERRLDLPTDRLEEALHPVLAGVLNDAGVTESDETIKATFLLRELTVVVTSRRLVRHVGEAVWDGDFEAHPYDEVMDLRFEEGQIATSVVLRLETGQERFKVPNDRARDLRERLIEAVLAHHGYETLSAFREARAPDATDGDGTVDFGDGPDPLAPGPRAGDDDRAQSPAETAGDDGGALIDRIGEVEEGRSSDPAGSASGADDDSPRDDPPASGDEADRAGDTSAPERADDPAADSFAESGFEPAGPVDDGDLAAEVAALREAIEEQNELLRAQGERIEEQGELVERLIGELRRGR